MLDLLAQALVATVALSAIATVLVFVRPVHRGAASLTSAIVAATAVALAVTALGWALGTPAPGAGLAGAVVGLTVGCWLPVARSWSVVGLVAWALAVDVGVLYLCYVVGWTVTSGLGVLAITAGMVLWVIEVFVFVLGLGYVWELVDVLARQSWAASTGERASEQTTGDGSSVRRPFVSLHVPAHNEPPEMVIDTLERLLRLDYDDYEVLLVDNNTTDPALWRPVEEFCAAHDRLVFIHLEDWPGFKSGALNYALTRTDPRAEVIGIVDADYHVDPDFLSSCAPLFNDAGVSFVQTPQDYRDWEVSRYFRRLFYSYSYFFDVSQRSRNERNGAIFGGTMGLIRRSELVAAGGWDEWCITEDAELSLRLLRAGGRGVHIDRAYGYGVMPLTFESLKGQRFRWCFGGVQILRMHWRSLLPGRRTADNQLTLAQRWAYLIGGLQWFGDLAALLFTGFLLLGAIDAISGDGLVVRRLSGLLLVSVVALVVLGAVRSVALIRTSSSATWREAAGAFGLWVGLGLTVARAAFLGLVSKEGTFLRTPKVKGEPTLIDALRGNRAELALAVLCTTVAAVALTAGSSGAITVGALLVLQGVGFLMAPINSAAAIRSELSAEMRDRRRWLYLRTTATPARRISTVLVGAGALLVALIVFAAPTGGPGAGVASELLDRVPGFENDDDTQLDDDPIVESPRKGPSGKRDVSITKSGQATDPTTSDAPSATPTAPPSPSSAPGSAPAPTPTRGPSQTPTTTPGQPPTSPPVPTPTTNPGQSPTANPGQSPTTRPTSSPTTRPTQAPTAPPGTGAPSGTPTRGPR